MSAAVVVPIWKRELTPDESLSLSRCLNVLGRHPIVLVSPQGLELPILPPSPAMVTVERFAPGFFGGIAGYNRLMLSAEFYRRLAPYEYVLLHQLDAFVFEDRLDGWCARGYDYVGAPWLGDGWPPASLSPLKRAILRAVTRGDRRVGNGGFSLRRVSSFLRTATRWRRVLAHWGSNEDLFWSVAGRRLGRLRIPPVAEAMHFSFELEPRVCYERLSGELPFGCHAWARYDPEFWRGILRRIGVPAPAGVASATDG